ncbi:MAG: glycosyltransferase family 2 protein [Candidatus Acidiferrales bacterium]
MPRPFATVLLDTYNHEAFVQQAIVSVLEQDFPPSDFEIIVVDDGSTDATPQLVQKFCPRVRYFRKSNGGQASAFNAAIPQALGEIVAFLDGDDWWVQQKLSSITKIFAEHLDVGIVGHGIFQLNSATGLGTTLVPERASRLDLKTLENAALFSHWKPFFGTSRVAIRKRVLENILPIPEALVVEADEFMSTLAVALSPAMTLVEPLAYYRLHPGNLFQFRKGSNENLRRKATVMACLAKELPPRLRDLGVAPEIIKVVLDPIWVDAQRLHLILEGGKSWETFRVEKKDSQLAYRRTAAGYRIFKQLVLGLALLLPPRLFYRLRAWYTARNLRRLRSWLGEPVPAAPVLERPLGASSGGRFRT